MRNKTAARKNEMPRAGAARKDGAAIPAPAKAVCPWWDAEGVGIALSVAAGLFFWVLCMSLPLVGKAAVHGSCSPGAGPLPSLGKNIVWFWTLWLATALLTAAAAIRWGAVSGWKWNQAPRHLWALAAALVLIGIAQPAGWLAL